MECELRSGQQSDYQPETRIAEILPLFGHQNDGAMYPSSEIAAIERSSEWRRGHQGAPQLSAS